LGAIFLPTLIGEESISKFISLPYQKKIYWNKMTENILF